MTDMETTLNLIEEYRAVAATARELEDAIRKSYNELAWSNVSRTEGAGIGYRIARALGHDLSLQVFRDEPLPSWWFVR